MKRLCISILIFFAAMPAPQAAEKTDLNRIHLASEEYAPFASKSLKHKGVLSHIISEAYRLEGIEVDYSFYPAARSFKLAQRGERDGTFPWAKRAGREIDFYYSDPIIKADGEYLFYKKNLKLNWNPENQDYSKLKGSNFGAIISYNYGQNFQKAEKEGVINVFRVSRLKQLFRMLLRDHIDIVISKEWVARYALQSNFSQEQIAQVASRPENTVGSSYDYLLFPRTKPTSKHFLSALKTGLAKLRSSGRYDTILNDLRNGEYAKPQK